MPAGAIGLIVLAAFTALNWFREVKEKKWATDNEPAMMARR